ncbi:MAG: DUF2802 domain-containing protein [Epulopiscium sp.]|nr:DUF2802 domain-containing protein [Candidatus Epulonipiscium sp.]
MTIEEIIPLAGMALIIVGFLIMLVGLVWMAHNISKEETNTSFSNTEDIIGEMNQMFSYFTDKIDRSSKDQPYEIREVDSQQDKKYKEVIELKKQGKTPDQIAKELNMGKGEVNLILGIDRMR